MPEQNTEEMHDSGISQAVGIILVAGVVIVLVAAGFLVLSNIMIDLQQEKMCR